MKAVSLLSPKAQKTLEMHQSSLGRLVPPHVIKIFFDEYAVTNDSGVDKISLAYFKTCCGLLDLEHTEEDAEKIFALCERGDTVRQLRH